MKGKMHFVIPDCQVKPGVSLDYLESIGRYIVHKKPEVIINLGDFADMHSLSSWDKGKLASEGRRYKADIDCVIAAQKALLGPLRRYNQKQNDKGLPQYRPRMILTLGNHEDRIDRAVEADPALVGALSIDALQYAEFGWEVVAYRDVIIVDGVAYGHYHPTGAMQRPIAKAARLLTEKMMSCVAGHQQGFQMATALRGDGKMLTGIIAGSCLAPHHKVLTAALDYVPLSSLTVGDKLVSFEDNPETRRGRRYKTGTVTALKTVSKTGFKVTLTNGKSFDCTADHRWLVKAQGGTQYVWKETNQLQTQAGLRAGTKIPILQEEWERLTSYDAGWAAGMYDGEGSLYQRILDENRAGAMQLSLSQKEGPTARQIARRIGRLCSETVITEQITGRDMLNFRIRGGIRKIVKVLGQLKPMRLVDKFRPEGIGQVTCSKEQHTNVLSVEPIGEIDVQMIEIDAGTMIVEGFGHHNCYLHEEAYLGPQGNKHWRGFLILHDVDDGEFSTQQVSLKHLNAKFPFDSSAPAGKQRARLLNKPTEVSSLGEGQYRVTYPGTLQQLTEVITRGL